MPHPDDFYSPEGFILDGPDLTALKAESLLVTRDRALTTPSIARMRQSMRESRRCPDCGLMEGHLFARCGVAS